MSLVLAADYRVRDFDAWWGKIPSEIVALARMSAHHVVVYRSVDDPGRIFVTIGVHEQGTLQTLLRSPDVFEWFDTAGVEDVPPVFAGSVVEKIDLHEGSALTGEPAAVIVASIVRLESIGRLQEAVHASLDGIREAGILRYWLYRALDDAHEAMIIREIATEQQARHWLRYPELGAKFMTDVGVGLYPPPFVGSLVQTIAIPADGETA